jgi:hypothetical protein
VNGRPQGEGDVIGIKVWETALRLTGNDAPAQETHRFETKIICKRIIIGAGARQPTAAAMSLMVSSAASWALRKRMASSMAQARISIATFLRDLPLEICRLEIIWCCAGAGRTGPHP